MGNSKMIWALALLASSHAQAQISDVYSTDADARARTSPGYVYADCANADFAPPLVLCAPLLISEKLDGISGDRQNDPHFSNAPDSNFFVLRSEKVPIAIPKVAYETQKSWVFQGRKYIKIKQGVPVLVTSSTADLIAVVGNADKIASLEYSSSLSDREVLANLVITLLYSPERGVEAIGFPGGLGTRGLYYCVKKPCLFAAHQ